MTRFVSTTSIFTFELAAVPASLFPFLKFVSTNETLGGTIEVLPVLLSFNTVFFLLHFL